MNSWHTPYPNSTQDYQQYQHHYQQHLQHQQHLQQHQQQHQHPGYLYHQNLLHRQHYHQQQQQQHHQHHQQQPQQHHQQQQQHHLHHHHQHQHLQQQQQQQQQHHQQQQLNSLEGGGGLHCGVPTRTTPTLTPTTLRNIEQTFLELGGVPAPETHNNQAGFVPPLIQPNAAASTSGGTTFISVDQKCWGGGVATLTTAPASTSGGSTVSTSVSSTATSGLPQRHPMYTSGALFSNNSNSSTSSTGSMPSVQQNTAFGQQPSRRTGGRRPNNADHLTPEEEERRNMRRERNKMAAARCRKRRLDQTNCLQDETDDLEDKKSGLQQEIQLLQQQRDELEFLLATHKAVCRRKTTHNNIKTTTIPSTIVSAPPPVATIVTTANPIQVTSHNNFTNNNISIQSIPMKEEVVIKEEPKETQDDSVVGVFKPAPSPNKPRRPTSLNVGTFALRNSTVADLGVPIETPSAGLRGLNFESMMDGGTGLTPVTNGTGLTPLSTGLTPLTTPVVTAPSQSSSNCSSQQRSSSSDLSSPDSVVPPKLVSL